MDGHCCTGAAGTGCRGYRILCWRVVGTDCLSSSATTLSILLCLSSLSLISPNSDPLGISASSTQACLTHLSGFCSFGPIVSWLPLETMPYPNPIPLYFNEPVDSFSCPCRAIFLHL